MTDSTAPVIVVGAGLAGLACARELARAGRHVEVLEASDGVGGRVRTDEVEGFLLDRGFQVLLTAYPEAKAQLDYPALRLRPFYPGAVVRFGGRFHRISDPFRRPADALRSLVNPIGSPADKLRVLALRRRAGAGSLDQLFDRPETSTMQALTRMDFSNALIERFFQPFLGGIFLGRELSTTSRMLEFVIRMFGEGDTAVPSQGMGAIPAQMAAVLPAGAVRTGVRVAAVDRAGVVLDDGSRVGASAVVVATEGDVAAALTGGNAPAVFRSVTNLYFAAPRPPYEGPYLILDGESRGPANNVAVMSEVAPEYAPAGRSLVSATVLGNPTADDSRLVREVLMQLRDWFGDQTSEWTLLRSYRIRWAQPDQTPPTMPPSARTARLAPGLFLAGDHVEHASIQGALAAGRRAAMELLAESATATAAVPHQ
ncbi:MAG TPA: NAD(P)/FAD-dependent oxidoreductase [Gemmatimonadales bacterium]|nr:NAD(P)/FAD-dependent oxidoreductase [Gemmatimonadales bacterium]